MSKTQEMQGQEPVEFPQQYRCGSPGHWVGSAMAGAFGCGKMFVKAAYDFHTRTCLTCRASMCSTYGVPQDRASALASALDLHHAYEARIQGFDALPKREAIRILILASGGEVYQPTSREHDGAARVVKRFPAMTGFWPEEHRNTVRESMEATV